jgi:putative transposase
MAVPKRQADPNAIVAEARTFFFTANAYGKRNLFQSDRTATLLIDVLMKNVQLGRFHLHAFVIMPDHLHALLTITREMTIEKVAQFIKGGFSFRAKRELGYAHEVWQSGYSEERVYSLDHFDSVVRYIHENPVRRRLALKCNEFRYSSANPNYSLEGRPTYLRG